jgi:pyridoxal phosphate enzyme (YggS family)
MELNSSEIKSNYNIVREKINHAAEMAGRNFNEVELVVVTKGHSVNVVKAALDAGIRTLGENYVEEAEQKIKEFQGQTDINWHMIGHIQSRKARKVCELFDYVHSLDSVKLARRLDRFADKIERKLPVLLECNVSGEESKFGWKAWDKGRWEELLPEFTEISSFVNLKIRGLMTMAPFVLNIEDARPYFTRLRELREYLNLEIKDANWEELSMGMSADYQIAIQEGATIIRVGTAILGQRI